VSDAKKINGLDDQIYHQMFSAILEQRVSPGTKLSEDALCGIFGVSRTVIRKVLQRLAHERVVDIQPNRGAFVAEPTPEEAKDVLEARKIVEAGIMRAAVRACKPADIKRLGKMLEKEAKSIDKGEHSKWVSLSGEFHLELAKIAGNQALEEFLRELVSRTSLIHVQYQKGNMGSQSCSCDEHADIINAIASGDEGKAVQLMDAHLDGIEESLNLNDEEQGSDLYKIFAGLQATDSTAGEA
jgi:DNA-binding GntR family transcriptional regulator